MKKSIIIPFILFILIVAGVLAYLFFFRAPAADDTTLTNPPVGFVPLNNGGNGGTRPTNNATTTAPGNTTIPSIIKVPTLRQLSATPIGGYGASTTASTTLVRWIDRGRGNILEAAGDTLDIKTISNTLLPRMYVSTWGKDLGSFIGSVLNTNNADISTLYAQLTAKTVGTAGASVATSTKSAPIAVNGASTAPYDLRGKNLPDGIVAFASSPKKDRVFLFAVQNGQGIGYVAPFNGGVAAQIFTTPLTQVNVEWPEENTIAIATKGTATQSGFLYFVNPKTGTWKKILGPLAGLSATVSHDAKYILVSTSGSANNVNTAIYSVATSTGNDAIIRTLAEKCVWGNFYKMMVYCAVPFQPVTGTYPDDWYKGSLTTTDKIWQVNAATGEVHLLSSPFDDAKAVIDGYNLGLDAKDNYLFFMNKNDLSFWSLDLVSSK